jgi:hypothetical protein
MLRQLVNRLFPLVLSSCPVLRSFILKIETLHPSESSVTIHQSTWRNLPEQLNLRKQLVHFRTLNEHTSCSSSYRFYIWEPNAVDVDWGTFLAPFNLSLWLGIMVVIFVVSVLLEACHQLNRHFSSCDTERRYQPFLTRFTFPRVFCLLFTRYEL